MYLQCQIKGFVKNCSDPFSLKGVGRRLETVDSFEKILRDIFLKATPEVLQGSLDSGKPKLYARILKDLSLEMDPENMTRILVRPRGEVPEETTELPDETSITAATSFLRHHYSILSDSGLSRSVLSKGTFRLPPKTKEQFFKILFKQPEEKPSSLVFKSRKSEIYLYESGDVKKKYMDEEETCIKREKLFYMLFDHPHILRAQAIFERSIFLERAECDLRNCIVQNHRYNTPENMRRYVKGVVDALEYLQRMQILHLDVKEENVLVFSEHIAKLGDFAGSFCMGMVECYRYTKECAAPEVIKRTLSLKSDVWSLGIMTYFTVFSSHPQRKDIDSMRDDDFHERDPDGALRRVIKRSVVEDFKQRASAKELQAIFEEVKR